MPLHDDLDWDQRPDEEGAASNSSFNEIYNEATVTALKAVIAAIDQGATIERIRELCESGIDALGGGA